MSAPNVSVAQGKTQSFCGDNRKPSIGEARKSKPAWTLSLVAKLGSEYELIPRMRLDCLNSQPIPVARVATVER